jgi:hypothetical protein
MVSEDSTSKVMVLPVRVMYRFVLGTARVYVCSLVSGLSGSKEIATELFKGPMSMENCTDKVQRCGFKGNELRCVLKLLRLNWEHRQIFLKLEDSEAKDYALEAIYGFVPPFA